MGRRKGELSAAEVDRRFPHQVILCADYYTGTNFRTVHAFCIGLSLAPRGHSIFKNDSWHYVFCFSEQADAEKFRDRFGGEWFDPATRGRGPRWHLPREPKKRFY